MSETTRDYGFITAITPEEIEALGNAKKGDQVYANWLDNPQWIVSRHIDADRGYYPTGNPIRRPISKDWANPASLLPSCTLPELSAELTQLRTLAKDQGEALEKAEKALLQYKCGWEHGTIKPDDYFLKRVKLTDQALTLIAKFKEVGE